MRLWRSISLVSIGLTLLSGGCSCSTSTPQPSLPETTPSAEVLEDSGTIVSQVPASIVSRVWNSAEVNSQTSEVPNEFHIHTYSDKEKVAAGIARMPFIVDAKERTVALLACTCTKPGCAARGYQGRPILFTQPYNEIQISPAGKLTQQMSLSTSAEADQKRVWGLPLCPVCSSNNDVEIYVLPETRQRMEELQAELKYSRHMLREARNANRQFPPGLRTPVVILEELKSIPQLYLTRKLKGP